MKKASPFVDSLMEDFRHPRGGVEERIVSDIERYRKGWGRFVLTDKEGKPLSGVKIRLKQKKHAFLFGCNLFKLRNFETEKENSLFEERFKKVFNHGTVAFYWDTLEPEPGKYRYAENCPKMDRRPPTDVAVDWCLKNGIRPKGHWLFCDNFVPKWLPKNGSGMMRLLEERIRSLAERYGNKVTIWDAVNEAFSNDRRFRGSMGWSATPQDYVYQVFRMAEKYFPLTTELVYNDGHAISFKFAHENSPMFLLCRQLLDRGVRLGGMGIQFHMYGTVEDYAKGSHAYFDPYQHLRIFDQYARLGIPLHMTETSLPTYPELPRKEGEQLQAEMLRSFFRLWFSHPAMRSIILWNFVDKTAYGGESKYDAGLLNRDMSIKPACEMLDHLVNEEWHTETEAVTDERGIADWNGFYGDYECTFTAGRTKIKETVLLRDDGENEIRKELK